MLNYWQINQNLITFYVDMWLNYGYNVAVFKERVIK